ncbi:protein FAM135A isoform X2 [Jatropha curcas]|uniref:protein FAM135A isoform X2 n=1 Tax=Jatropha curcas TaxID=180498 RepID=UPI001893C8EB|nr:protein FAM135A isoform X2 [Jatropha curcas]
MWDTVQQIAIYIHRFHNLDLFQQGFYQIKVTMRWEDSEYASIGTPARVVQYEAHDMDSDSIYGAWRINDTDNSFLTQPFRIKYARQDVYLSVMISFDLSLSKYKVPSTSAVILKFELLQAPITENRLELLAYLEASSVAVHEFRIPPKALFGLHSYCPIHFDIFHAVLVEASVHVSLLKAGSHAHKSSDPYHLEDVPGESIDERPNQALASVSFVAMNKIMLIKTLLVARDTLLEELQRLSKAIAQVIDFTDFTSKMNDINMLDSIRRADLGTAKGEVGGRGSLQNGLEKANGIPDFEGDKLQYILSNDALENIFHLLGTQLSYLWSTFLQFHRTNKKKILRFLRDAWAKDRRTEWSIWMVYSKVEMPHHYISSGTHDASHIVVDKRVSSFWKLADDPAQTAATRAELHRRSIAQMRINASSIQDMYIFGDPLRVPIIYVERVINAPRRTFSENSYFRNLDLIDSPSLLAGPGPGTLKKLPGGNSHKKSRELKIVVFVHGFQGHHLDLRLIRNQWLLIDPKIEILMSEANEEKTSGDFREMGLRLAQEVISFLKKKSDKYSRSGGLRDIKLSFVGHSIGNVIIRTALAESIMEPFRRHLYTYISLSGPQLGYLYSSNSLFNSGMWFMKKFRGTQCIHQLTFTDDPNLKNTFFYRLCEKTLENFRHIILISSPQDGYVPYHSARIELCRAASLDYSRKGRIFLEMLNNCLDQIRAPTSQPRVFMRCDVNFDTSNHGRNFNSFIGRTAHIEFLESDIFARFIMWSFQELFR